MQQRRTRTAKTKLFKQQKGSIQKEDVIFINTYAPIIGTPQLKKKSLNRHEEKKLTGIQ